MTDSFDISDNAQGAGALVPWCGKAILLVDLDAFFASVEQLDHPRWRGKPVIVGGDSDRRGVVSTASYEARKFGVHSAMASVTAKKLCPDAIWTEGHYGRYREVSNQVMDILRDETPLVQQVSIDEAFMDVTPTRVNTEHPVAIAERIQARVAELGVTCSIGVGTTKSIAKLASDMDKPQGLTVVYPGSEQGFMDPLPVRALSGVGKASEAKLAKLGIKTLGDLRKSDTAMIEREFGKNGHVMLERARGLETGEVETDDDVKSVSNEVSFAKNITTYDDVHATISSLSEKVARRLRGKGLRGKTITLKLRYANRSVRSIQSQIAVPTDDKQVIREQCLSMLGELWCEPIELRLIGVAVTKFGEAGEVQESLFADESESQVHAASTSRFEQLAKATDLVKNRFGENSVQYGFDLRAKKNTTGTSAKNPADYK